jgi:hypothetical protein
MLNGHFALQRIANAGQNAFIQIATVGKDNATRFQLVSKF